MVSEDSGLLQDGEKIELGDTKSPYYETTATSSTSPLPGQKTGLSIARGPLKPINTFLNKIENNTRTFIKDQSTIMKYITLTLFAVAYITYFIIACNKDFKRARDLVYITSFALFCIIYWAVKKYLGHVIWNNCIEPVHAQILVRWKIIKWVFVFLFIGFVIFWLAYDSAKEPERLISLLGLFVYVLIGYLFSKNRDQVKWRPVLWGFSLQFVFGLLILRTSIGYQFFKWLGDRMTIFLGFSSAGSSFLFRGLDQFAFALLPVIVFFSATTYVVYYLGWIQIVITKIAWLLQVTMGTSPAESVNAAGNIFIGQTEAPLLIHPFLEGMTESELHAVMTGGFATIAGSVLGAYISFGVSASHLLSASVMSAPAALAMAKLMYPETEEPAIKNVDDIQIEKTEEKNIFEALAVGASMSIALIANIAVMLIAFLASLAFINAILHWLGAMVDIPELSFEFICSYLFMPFAYIMGVEWDDAFQVAELLGVKTFLNEFVAYERLSDLIKNRVNNVGTFMSIRSEVITTYALCGFANFGSIGVQLGGLSVLAPSKRPILSKIVLRAMIAGTMACFMTACIAGLLYDETRYDTTIKPDITTTTTSSTNLTLISTTVSTLVNNNVANVTRP